MDLKGVVDFHHHIVPPGYREAIDAATAGSIGGIPQPAWSEETMLRRIDKLGIGRALVSISAPALAPIATGSRDALAVECNDVIADLIARHPGVIGGFALLPLPDVPTTLAEIGRSLDELKLDGVAVLTNYDGVYLGDPVFAPVLEELDRRGTLVHVHPNVPPPMPDAKLTLPPPVLEFTFDTTRMIAEMIVAETMRKYEHLRLVLSHLGGTLPWVAWRLSMLDDFPSVFEPAQPRRSVRDELRRFHYDVALSASPPALAMASEIVGADRLVYGSDMPFVPKPFMDSNNQNLVEAHDLLGTLHRTTDTLLAG